MPRISMGYVTRFVPDLALNLIALDKLTFDKRVKVHRGVRPHQNLKDPRSNTRCLQAGRLLSGDRVRGFAFRIYS